MSRNGEIDLQRSKRIDLTAVSPASIKLSGNYDILIPALVNNAVSGVVALNGQVQRPGNYTVGRDETLHDIIERAGGFTEVAYPLGAVLTRQSLKEEQTRANLSGAASRTIHSFPVAKCQRRAKPTDPSRYWIGQSVAHFKRLWAANCECSSEK